MVSKNIKPEQTFGKFTSNNNDIISNDENTKAFIPTRTWLGEKKGFYFGTGDEGTGYYIDSLQQKDETITVQQSERNL